MTTVPNSPKISRSEGDSFLEHKTMVCFPEGEGEAVESGEAGEAGEGILDDTGTGGTVGITGGTGAELILRSVSSDDIFY